MQRSFGLLVHDPANCFFTSEPIKEQFGRLAVCVIPDGHVMKVGRIRCSSAHDSARYRMLKVMESAFRRLVHAFAVLWLLAADC